MHCSLCLAPRRLVPANLSRQGAFSAHAWEPCSAIRCPTVSIVQTILFSLPIKFPYVPFLLWFHLVYNERRNETIYLDLVLKFYPDLKWYFDWQAHIQKSSVIRPQWQLQAQSQESSDPEIGYCQPITSQCAKMTKFEFLNLIYWNKPTVLTKYCLHNHLQ